MQDLSIDRTRSVGQHFDVNCKQLRICPMEKSPEGRADIVGSMAAYDASTIHAAFGRRHLDRSAAVALIQRTMDSAQMGLEAAPPVVAELADETSTSLPELPDIDTLLLSAARMAGLGPWIRYGERLEFIYCSAEAAKVFGVEADHTAPVLLRFWNFLHPIYRTHIADLLADIGRNPRRYDVLYAIILPDGRIRWVAESAEPQFDRAGSLTHYLGVFQDITRHGQSHRFPDCVVHGRRSGPFDRQCTDALNLVNHEVRTALNAVIGFSELMLDQKEDVLPDDCAEYIRNIRGCGLHLLSFIDDLLAIALRSAAVADVAPTDDQGQP